MCYDKSDSADNFPESCCVEVLNWKKKVFQMVQNFEHSSWRFYPKRKVPRSPNPIEMELIGAWILCNIRLEDYLRIRYDFFFNGQTHYVWFIMADICLLHLDCKTIFKSDIWPFQIVLSQFRQSWAFEVRGMTFATFGCDLVLLPLPYLVRHK